MPQARSAKARYPIGASDQEPPESVAAATRTGSRAWRFLAAAMLLVTALGFTASAGLLGAILWDSHGGGLGAVCNLGHGANDPLPRNLEAPEGAQPSGWSGAVPVLFYIGLPGLVMLAALAGVFMTTLGMTAGWSRGQRRVH